MTQTVRKGKQNRHEKITVVLLSGNPVSVEDIQECFKGTDQEAVLYRLSTNIYNIRKDGGVIKVHKNGRKVTAYQLMNPQDFDSNGRFVHRTSQVSQPVQAEVTEPVAVAGEVEVTA